MATHRIVGIYGSIARARVVQEALIDAGMPEEQVSIGLHATADALRQERTAEPLARRSRGGVVTVAARTAHEAARIRRLMAAWRPLDLDARAG